MAYSSEQVNLDHKSRFKPYAATKDSGVEWLAEIPNHWHVKKLKQAFNVCLGKMLQPQPTSSRDTLKPYLRAANLDWEGAVLDDVYEMWFSPEEMKELSLKEGDLLISEGGDVGRSAIWRGELEDCYFQNSVNRVRSEGEDSTRFLYYWIYTIKHCGYIDILCNKATISHFTAEKVGRVHTILPPPSEQQAIVAFLDRETAGIDALVAKKERLIELLQEKRAALISQAVSKGLDPTVPMKDSGMEWLGQIPAHWQVMHLKHVVSIYGGGTPSKDNPSYWSGDIPWVSPKDMKQGLIEDTEEHVTKEAIAQSSTRVIESGAVLIVVRSGILNHSIPVAINLRPVALNQDMKALVLSRILCSGYLRYLITGHQKALLLEWRKEGATVESIEHELLANTRIPIPAIDEQNAVAEFLNHESETIDALIAKVREGIERLKEYRTALISAAVTGKIDVRETAI